MRVITGKLVIKKSLINSDSLFLMFYAIMPLVDTLNGFILIQLKESFSVGLLYRFLLIALMLHEMFSKNCSKKYFYFTVKIFVCFAIISLFHIVSEGSLRSEISLVMQWLLTPVYMLGFLELKRRGKIGVDIINRIFDIYAWLVVFTIIIPKFLGIGFNTYGGGIGYKGFYYANNGVSFLASILVMYSFYKLFESVTLLRLLQTGLLIVTCLLLGTKSSIITVAVAVIFAIILNSKKYTLRGVLTTFLIFAIIVATYIRFQNYISLKINEVLQRYYYMSSLYNEGFWDSITTGRTIKAERLWHLMKEASLYPFNILTGMGSQEIVSEMDLLDLFFSYGLIGVFFALCYVIVLTKTLVFDNNIYKIMLLYSLAYSFIVGHVFNNSMSLMVFVLILSSANLKQETIVSNKSWRDYENIHSNDYI